jgi:hypothetical protein
MVTGAFTIFAAIDATFTQMQRNDARREIDILCVAP